jgi:hypothetical protein
MTVQIEESVFAANPSPMFEEYELQAMHRYCLKYAILVLSDKQPTPEQDENFLLFSRICYATGVACA